MGIFVKFCFFYDARSPNMVMSRTIFNIRKSHKILVAKLSTSEVISQKPHGGGGGKHPPPSVFRAKRQLSPINKLVKILVTANGLHQV